MSTNSDRLVKIGVAHDEIEAGIWRDALEGEGVPVFIKSLDPMTPLGMTPAPGSLQLFVLARDEKRARWILGELAAST